MKPIIFINYKQMRIRVIPILLIKDGGLVKGVNFKNYKYVGDPINAVKIFNDKEVDEICVIDISATANKKMPNIAAIKEIASEAFMPMGYGGGVSTVNQIVELINSGVEKVIINSAAYYNSNLINEGAKQVGNQSIVISIDVKKNWLGKQKVFIENGTKSIDISPIDYAKKMVDLGAGEIALQSIDKDGTFSGYDLELIHSISNLVNVPLIAMAGAADVLDFKKAIQNGASAVAAGSMFVFQRPHKAVLITYPSQTELKEKLFN
jgi:imidazole glycerol-phosphate synthase subunit HisF